MPDDAGDDDDDDDAENDYRRQIQYRIGYYIVWQCSIVGHVPASPRLCDPTSCDESPHAVFNIFHQTKPTSSIIPLPYTLC